MIQYSSNYEVAPCSRLDLRNYAKQLRQTLGIDTPYFPICQLLEVLPNFGIQYDYIDDATWDFVYGKDNHARYDLTTKTISVKESVYERALQNHGRDRYTIAHEIAHALLLDGNNIERPCAPPRSNVFFILGVLCPDHTPNAAICL